MLPCPPLGQGLCALTLAPSPFCLQTRPTPPHLTSAMAENILAAACESETRKAAKRMRLEIYQSSQVPARCQPLGGCPQPSRRYYHGPWVQREQGGRPQMGDGDAGGRGAVGGESEEPRHKGLADLGRESGLHPEP